MSQRSLFNHASRNIFYEDVARILKAAKVIPNQTARMEWIQSQRRHQRKEQEKGEVLEVILNEFLNIHELSQYLNIRKSTLYSMVEKREIPCFRFGRLIRFKRQEIDAWTETHREKFIDSGKKGREVFRGAGNARTDIDRIVQKSIESVKNSGYNHGHGKPDRIKGLRKEVEHGSL